MKKIPITVGIDATNISRGGGLTHLYEILDAFKPEHNLNIKIVLWAPSSVLKKINQKDWLRKITNKSINSNLFRRTLWQLLCLSNNAERESCDVLFIPGGSYYGTFKPFVSMHRNLLPFEYGELFRFGLSWTSLKLITLRFIQSWTFKRSNGVIFLTEYCKKIVGEKIGKYEARTAVIPHGFNIKFMSKPKNQLHIENYSQTLPYKLIYVSIIDLYKHQWNVVEAVSNLRNEGFPLTLDLIGPSSKAAMNKLNKAINQYDPNRDWVFYKGEIQYGELTNLYKESDLAVFASSCETISNILLEKMASGLPIACSNSEPLPEVLGEGGVYFNPENSNDIAHALKTLIENHNERRKKSNISFSKAKNYSWKNCSKDTFSFLKEVLHAKSNQNNN